MPASLRTDGDELVVNKQCGGESFEPDEYAKQLRSLDNKRRWARKARGAELERERYLMKRARAQWPKYQMMLRLLDVVSYRGYSVEFGCFP